MLARGSGMSPPHAKLIFYRIACCDIKVNQIRSNSAFVSLIGQLIVKGVLRHNGQHIPIPIKSWQEQTRWEAARCGYQERCHRCLEGGPLYRAGAHAVKIMVHYLDRDMYHTGSRWSCSLYMDGQGGSS